MAEYQLRMYEIAPGRMDEFVEAFRNVVEARAKHGFSVVGAWVVEGEDRFVWIAGYEGSDGFEAASARYYDSPERRAIDPDPGSFLTAVETHMVHPVDL